MNVRGTMKAQVTNYLELGGDLNYTHDESNGSNVGFGNNGNLSSVRDYATLVSLQWIILMPVAISFIRMSLTLTVLMVHSGRHLRQAMRYLVQQIATMQRQMEIENPTRNNRVLANVYADLTLMKGLHAKTILSYNHNGTDSA